jgi:hypothetical protein
MDLKQSLILIKQLYLSGVWLGVYLVTYIKKGMSSKEIGIVCKCFLNSEVNTIERSK